MAQLLLISTAAVRTLAVYIFWCAGLGEAAFTLDASNAGAWMLAAWVITLGCAAMGVQATRSAAWLFLVGDGLAGTVFLGVTMLGGVPAGLVGIPVARDASALASGLLFASTALQGVLLRQSAAEPRSRRVLVRSSMACWLGVVLIAASLSVYADAGRRAGEARLADHEAQAAALSADGRGAGGLSAARRSLLILAADPGFADPDRSRGPCLCAGEASIPSRVTARLAQPSGRSGFTYLWRGGYERALQAGLCDEALLTVYLDSVSMGRTAPGEYVTGFFAASQHHFGRAPQALDDEEFYDLTLTLATRGFVGPSDEAQAEAGFALNTVTRRMEEACADPRLSDHNRPGCGLFEAQRGR